MNKSFLVLSLFVLLALGGGFWLIQAPVKEVNRSEPVFKNFASTVSSLQSIKIENAQGVLLDAVDDNSVWVASVEGSMPKYPVSKIHLAELLQTLSEVRLLEAKTSKSQNFYRLGLQALYAEDSIATLITLNTSRGEESLLVGKMATSGHGSFIRKPSETQTWLSDKKITVPADKFSWLQQPILPFQTEDILSITRADQENWRISRDIQSSKLVLNGIPDGFELKYDAVLNSIMMALTDLSFERLLHNEGNLIRSFEVLTILDVTTMENKRLKLTLGKRGEQHFVYFTAIDEEPYWSLWVYQVSNFSAQQLLKSKSDFLTEIKATPPDESALNITQFPIDEGDSPY